MKILGLLLTTIAVCFIGSLAAQSEFSAFTITGKGTAGSFATDYHALGINPSNLDWAPEYEGKFVTFGLSEFAGSIYSEALTKKDVRANLFQKDFDELTYDDKLALSREFATTSTAIDADLMSFGVGVATNKLGGFAFSIRDNFEYFSTAGELASDLIYLGYQAPYFENLVIQTPDSLVTIPNDPDFVESPDSTIVMGYTNKPVSMAEALDGTHVSMQWVREYQIGYGKKIYSNDSWALYGGIGLKYLVGNAILQLDAEDGEVTAFGAVSPIFDINYDLDEDEVSPSQLPEDAAPLAPVGRGFGLDLGASMIIQENIRLGVAVTNIGSMTWDGNLYKMDEGLLDTLYNGGVESNDYKEQLQAWLEPEGLFEWEGTASQKTKLPTRMSVSGRMDINEQIRVGVEAIFPVNDVIGNLDRPIISVGGDISPAPFVRFSLGFVQGGNYDFKIPVGVSFHIAQGTWEVGIASRDMITFFTENQPTVSASFGFLRFRI
jgi:hypothetical protein